MSFSADLAEFIVAESLLAMPYFWISRCMQASSSPHFAMIFWMSACRGAIFSWALWAFSCLFFRSAFWPASISCMVGRGCGVCAIKSALSLTVRLTLHW